MALYSAKWDVKITVDEIEEGTIDLGTGSKKHVFKYLLNLVDGTTSGKFDLFWGDTRTLSTTSEALDLYGSLVDTFGDTINMVELVAMVVYTADAGVVTIGGAASQAVPIFSDATDKFPLRGPGFFGFATSSATGYGTIGAGSNDQLKIETSAAMDYTIMLFGRTA